MTSIRTAWRLAWTTLPAPVHRVLSQPDVDDTWFPTNRTIRSLFPTVFGSALPDDVALPAKLRGYSYIRSNRAISALDAQRPDDQQVERIRTAVAAQSARLTRLAEFLPELEKRSTATMFGVADKREAVLKLAWEKAAALTLDADAALAAVTAVPTIAGIRRLLDDEEIVEALTRRRDAVPARCRPHDADVDLRRSSDVIAAYLDDEPLDALHRSVRTGIVDAADLVGSGTPSAAKWDAVLGVDATLWEWRTAGLGLSRTSPPGRAPVRIAAEHDDSSGVPRAWLDASIERRLGSVLGSARVGRLGLAPEHDLLEREVDRAAQPLGVRHDAARSVLACGATLVPMIGIRDAGSCVVGADLPDTLVAKRIRARLRKWMCQREETVGTASMPHIRNVVSDPSAHYMAALWTRVHGHDVRGSVDGYHAATVHDLLTGIARTVINRVDSAVLRPAALSSPDGGETATDIDVVLLATAVGHVREAVNDSLAWQDFWAAAISDDPLPAPVAERWRMWTADAGITLDLGVVVTWLRGLRPE